VHNLAAFTAMQTHAPCLLCLPRWTAWRLHDYGVPLALGAPPPSLKYLCTHPCFLGVWVVMQVFVSQVYKRCEGQSVSKVAVIEEMEEERARLQIGVTDYVKFCRCENGAGKGGEERRGGGGTASVGITKIDVD
jgi:hypothetical protein